MKFEPYPAQTGCLACPVNGVWYVVEPSGKAQPAPNEYEARTMAMFRSLTATEKEIEEWTNRKSIGKQN